MLNKTNNSIELSLLNILQQGSLFQNVRGEHNCKFLSRTRVQVFNDPFSDIGCFMHGLSIYEIKRICHLAGGANSKMLGESTIANFYLGHGSKFLTILFLT